MGCCGSKAKADPEPPRPRMRRTQSSVDATPAFDAKTYSVKYQARVPVSQYNDAAVADAQKRIKRESAIHSQTASLLVSASHIRVTNADSELLFDCVISEVKFVATSPKDKKGISVISLDRNQVGFCHFFAILSGTANDVRQSIGAAFQAAAEVAKRDKGGLSQDGVAYARRMTRMGDSEMAEMAEHAAREAAAEKSDASSAGHPEKRNAVQSGKDASEILGTFEMTYLGSAPVQEKNGKGIAIREIQNVLLAKLTKNAAPKVAFIVSGEAIKVVDMISSEPTLTTPVRSISYHTMISSKDSNELIKRAKKKVKDVGVLVSIFVNDQRLKRTTVVAFSCASEELGMSACAALNSAFKVQVEIQKLRKKNPFAAISSKREASPKSLFALQIHRSDLAALKVIGYGQFGEVYLAKHAVRASSDGEKPGANIVKRAVKILRGSANVTDRAEFLKEAESMIGLNHPNVVKLIGVAVQQRPWLTVIEFVEYGDLLAVAKTCAEKNFVVTQKEFLVWFVQIAAAMEYIASLNMIHMDLAARNVLLGKQNTCKIADFGLTRKINPEKPYYRLMKTMKLPVKWMAIESMTEKIFSLKTDVWALGITFWEVLSYGAIPYGSVKNIEVQKLVSKGLRAVKPERCSEALYQLLLTMWDEDPEDRPDFSALKNTVQGLHEQENGSVRDVGEALRNFDGSAKSPPIDDVKDNSRQSTQSEQDGAVPDRSVETDGGNQSSDDSDESVDSDSDPEVETGGSQNAVSNVPASNTMSNSAFSSPDDASESSSDDENESDSRTVQTISESADESSDSDLDC